MTDSTEWLNFKSSKVLVVLICLSSLNIKIYVKLLQYNDLVLFKQRDHHITRKVKVDTNRYVLNRNIH